ncbi:unnamed protein product [Cladocopium goreaui]|uniref:Uncharacterized protein n=1 Tax=Cladocopium goreaui TaxID=2562237 RepID=A0A9P1FP20_9DINO|nr:unnamed protein product [Cladocopium goreaui]
MPDFIMQQKEKKFEEHKEMPQKEAGYVTPSLPDMHFVVDAIDDVYTALFPKHGYEIEVCAGGEINLHHPEIPEELAIMSEPRFIQDDEEDEWAIYPTRDGDTLWNSNENKDCTPSYLQDVFENLRNSILARDETLERANRKSKLKKCSTDQPVTAGTPEIDQTDVAKKDRVFLHESKGKMYVARPFDLLQVELGITDPILNVVHYVGKTCSKNVVVITVKMEYLRRSRPLRFTKWSITEVSRWMRYHVHGKDQNEDCGAFAKYFQPGDNGGQSPFPADMLAWEKKHHKEEHEEKPVLHSRRAMINALISVDDFPTTGYIGKRKGDKFVITHPDLPPPLLHCSGDDEFEIFVTNDGDTVWNGKETDPENETDPEYVHETLQKMQAEAQKEEDSDEEDGNDEQDEDVMPIQDRDSMFAAEDDVSDDSSDDGVVKEPEPADPLSNIKAEEKVFLHKIEGSWYIVRPADNMHVVAKYSDPVLAQMKLGDKWVVIVDSGSKEAGSKSRYTETLLGGRRAEAVTDSVLLQECQK